MTTKAPRLQPGDTVGIVSPSWGGGARYPHRIERGAAHLRSLGFRVKIAPHALNSIGYVSDTPENRAADIHAMFLDPEVTAIIASIGGDHSCHLLPLLDFDLIAAHPKIFMGYSDITVLNVAISAQTGLVTFNGPALMTDFAEYPAMLEYTESYFFEGGLQPCTSRTNRPVRLVDRGNSRLGDSSRPYASARHARPAKAGPGSSLAGPKAC